MCSFKKVMSALLVMAMVLSLVFAASALESPITAPVNPGYDQTTDSDINIQDHSGDTVTSKITSSGAIVLQAVGEKAHPRAYLVTLKVARDEDNEKVAITKIGDGKKGVFDTKAGKRITSVIVSSDADRVTIAAKAFKGSKVKSLRVTSQKLSIRKDAFKGTKAKSVTITVSGSKKKASDFKFSKGAFNGLGSRSKFIVKKKAMSRSEFNKLKKALKKAGFKGKITRE